MNLDTKKFTPEQITTIKSKWYGSNWPVVYILTNSKEAYIGESSRVGNRLIQHLDNPMRTKLTDVNIIADERFNKSAILDIESKLIEYMSADEQYIIQNNNAGMKDHDYYEKEEYKSIFKSIWTELQKKKIVKNDLTILENTDLFKYTPYKSLSEDQYKVAFDIATDFLNNLLLNEPATFVVNGEAGTGKTILAMYILKLLTDGALIDFVSEDDELLLNKYESLRDTVAQLKVAIVVPMTSLRKTLKGVVKKIPGLKSSMIIGPSDVVKQEYDFVIVDESHRLSQRVNLPNFGSFDKSNEILGLGHEGTQLDWIMMRSKYQLFFYDSGQTVRPSDITPEKFDSISELGHFYVSHRISSQMRSMGGEDYLNYIKDIFDNKPDLQMKSFSGYDLTLFDSISKMRKKIRQKNEEFGLSRMMAGYAWKWKTKKLTYDEIASTDTYDIIIDEEKMIWNKTASGWINSENAINEVGGIHTTQGYDLNYAGIIIGNELRYDPDTRNIIIDKEEYFDVNGKRSILDEEELKDYIINIYRVLMTRSIKGTYVYVMDDNLREYLRQYIPPAL